MIIKDIEQYTKEVYEKLEHLKEIKKENLTEFKKNKDALKKYFKTLMLKKLILMKLIGH